MLIDTMKRDARRGLGYDWHKEDGLLHLYELLHGTGVSPLELQAQFEATFQERLFEARLCTLSRSTYERLRGLPLPDGLLTLTCPAVWFELPDQLPGQEAWGGALLFFVRPGESLFGVPLRQGLAFLLVFDAHDNFRTTYIFLEGEGVSPRMIHPMQASEQAVLLGLPRERVEQLTRESLTLLPALLQLLLERGVARLSGRTS